MTTLNCSRWFHVMFGTSEKQRQCKNCGIDANVGVADFLKGTKARLGSKIHLIFSNVRPWRSVFFSFFGAPKTFMTCKVNQHECWLIHKWPMLSGWSELLRFSWLHTGNCATNDHLWAMIKHWFIMLSTFEVPGSVSLKCVLEGCWMNSHAANPAKVNSTQKKQAEQMKKNMT